jgi:hypothetical protein
MAILMVNCGTRPYQVNGYPVVRVLDADRKPLVVTVNKGTSAIEAPGPTPITLTPGETATAVLLWRNTVTDAQTDAVEGSYVEITPANGEHPQTVPEHIDLGNTGKVDITAWRRP